MKKILTFVLCTLLMIALAAPVSAAGEEFLRSYYTTQDDDLILFGGNAGKDGTVTVSADGAQISDAVISTVEQQQIGITYFCIVDPSSSFSKNQKDQQRDALLAISENMRPIDRMVLAKMEQEQLNVGSVMETKEACDAAIRADWAVSRSTNLFTDVVSATYALQDSSRAPGLCCVILMTDGINDGNDGKATSAEQAQEAVKNSGVSFNTIALVNLFPDTYALRCADNALNLVDSPFRGLAFTPVKQDMTAADAALAIMDNAMGSTAIRINTASLNHAAPQQQIQVSVQGGSASAKNTIIIPTDQLPAVPAPVETEPPTTAETQPETTQPEVKSSLAQMSFAEAVDVLGNDVYYILIGGCVLVILAVSAVLILFSRKRREDEADNLEILESDEEDDLGLPEFMEKPQQTLAAEEIAGWEQVSAELLGESRAREKENPEPDALPVFDFAPESEKKPAAAAVAVAEALIPESGCILKLIPTVDEAWTTEYFLPVNSSKTFGRSQRSDFVLNETDYGLSGIHFEMLWDGRALFLRDRNSTNGTALNNVPLIPEKWARLKNGAVILAGAYEYRVSATRR